jgi:hypothetical protein
MALRRKIETAVLLAEVVRRIRARGRPDFEVADIFMDFDAMQITLEVMAQAVIDGRIDCKAAGRLAVGLQTAMKLLRMIHRKRVSATEARRHAEQQRLPQISAEEHRLDGRNASTAKDTKEYGSQPTFMISKSRHFSEASEFSAGEEGHVYLMNNRRRAERAVIIRNGFRRNGAHAPPEFKRAA